MNKTEKIIVGIIAIVVTAWVGYRIYQKPGQAVPVQKETVKIGAILPLSGNLAFMGVDAQKAILLAKENLGDTKYNYEISFEDDQFDAKRTASAVSKFINVDNVDVVMSFASGPGNVVSPIAENAKVIHFANATDPNVAKGAYNFIHWTAPSEEARAFVAELQRRGVKKLGIFVASQQGVLATTNAIKENLKNTDIQIATEQRFNVEDKDFRSIIAKAQNSGAEIYLMEAFPPALEILVKQMKDAGMNKPLTSVELFEATEQKNLFEGQWYINAAEPTADFINKFKTKYGADPNLGAANEYDMINMLVMAYEKAGNGTEKPSRESVINELHQIKDFNGALGKLTMGSDNIVISKAVVRMIKDGKPVTISQ